MLGTKAAAHYQKILQPGEEFVVRVRFSEIFTTTPFAEFDATVELRKAEVFFSFQLLSFLPELLLTHHCSSRQITSTKPFKYEEDNYSLIITLTLFLKPPCISDELKLVQRQAFAGLLWSKQFYHYGVDLWLKGDPNPPYPPKERLTGRNSKWRHLYTTDVLSMPDKWEYPWFAAW